jgi:hypothetical protein
MSTDEMFRAAVTGRNEPARVEFNPDQPTGNMPIDWASKGLTWLYRERRSTFADMMLHILDAERAPRKPKP